MYFTSFNSLHVARVTGSKATILSLLSHFTLYEYQQLAKTFLTSVF